MTLPQHLLLTLSISTAMAVTGTSYSFQPSRDPFSSSLPPESTPQFIVLTFDDSITPLATALYSKLAKVRHQDGCPITATWYTSIAAGNEGNELTKCNLVKSLRRGGHEIATHTYGHTGDPTLEEIEGARRWLSEGCGLPREEIRGFRAPYLKYSQDTFVRLRELGFLYDSSVTDRGEFGSNGGREHFWPYTMDDCGATAWSCDTDKAVPGLFEVPMWTMFEAGTEDTPLIPMDYPGNAYEILNENFYRRYDVTQGGNRAPMGIFLHAAWLEAHGESLRQWAEDVLVAHDDVYFVTNYQLLQWMSNPVPSWEYNREEFCSGLMPECLPPPTSEGGCGYGSFDPELCKCQCRPPYSGRNCLEVNHGGGANSPVSPPTISCDTLPQYSIRSYSGGERVVHNGNSIYKCKDWLNTGKCEQGEMFEPGVGQAWKEAWDEIGTCTVGKTNADTETVSSMPASPTTNVITTSANEAKTSTVAAQTTTISTTPFNAPQNDPQKEIETSTSASSTTTTSAVTTTVEETTEATSAVTTTVDVTETTSAATPTAMKSTATVNTPQKEKETPSDDYTEPGIAIAEKESGLRANNEVEQEGDTLPESSPGRTVTVSLAAIFPIAATLLVL